MVQILFHNFSKISGNLKQAKTISEVNFDVSEN
jgi:hypothetical protein